MFLQKETAEGNKMEMPRALCIALALTLQQIGWRYRGYRRAAEASDPISRLRDYKSTCKKKKAVSEYVTTDGRGAFACFDLCRRKWNASAGSDVTVLSVLFISFAHTHTFFLSCALFLHHSSLSPFCSLIPFSYLYFPSMSSFVLFPPSHYIFSFTFSSCSGVGVLRRRGLRWQQHHVGGGLGDAVHLQPGVVSQQPSGAHVALPFRQLLLLLLHILLRLSIAHSFLHLLLLPPVSSVQALQPGPSQHRVAVRLRPHLAGARASKRVQWSVVTRMWPGERWVTSVFEHFI